MTLPAGHQLGRYEILAPLGAGGMGEVYSARDSELGREVAVKVLPARLQKDGEALARFELEARAVAALSHPNILAIHDFGRSDGLAYAVVERLEGETLRALLHGGRLPARQVVDYALQIAEGLAAAHDKGVVHRDLKPENLFVTREGRVKILDFGLAKVTGPVSRDGDTSPSLSLDRSTDPGTVLGTVGYMSPEQVRGEPADSRSDIFSFGVVLAEMLQGQRPFQRETKAETMAAILREEPFEAGGRSSIPAGLAPLLRHCLEKKPEGRFRSAHDLAFALATVGALAGGGAGPSTSSRPRWRPAVVGLALGALLAGALVTHLASEPPPPSQRRLTFRRGFVQSARFAPDGHTIVYGAAWEGHPIQLYSARTDEPGAQPLALPDGDVLAVPAAGEMVLSLGRRFKTAHMSSGTLARAPLAGGASREILEGVQEADVSADGNLLAIVRRVGGRHRLEYPPGKVLYETTGWVSHPRLSPGGDRIAVMDHPIYSDDQGTLMVIDRSGRRQTLTREPWNSIQGLAWSPAGDEVWFTAGETVDRALRAVTLGGTERLVLRVPGSLTLQDISRDGKVLLSHGLVRAGIRCLPPGETRERDLSWFDYSYGPSLSRDGKRVVLNEAGSGGPNYGVYLRPTDGSPAARLGDGEGQALSPDGRRVLVIRYSPTQDELMLLPTGAGETRPLTTPGLSYTAGDWFPDGERVLFEGHQAGHGNRLFVQDVAGGAPRPITPEGFGMRGFSSPIAPDGQWVAALDADSRTVLFPVAGGEPRLLAGVAAEDEIVRWSADGRYLHVSPIGQPPKSVYPIEVATGRRGRPSPIVPADPTGMTIVNAIRTTEDGAYAYRYQSVVSDLYLMEGLR